MTGMDTRKALRLAKTLGCTIVAQKGTGEVRVMHPSWGRSILVQVPSRRKDASKVFTTHLKRLGIQS
jgi:hypothetical protein